MSTVSPVCSGLISLNPSGFLDCSTGWAVVPTPVTFDFSQIDPAIMGEAIAAGFILSYGLTALAWGGRLIIHSIMGSKL